MSKEKIKGFFKDIFSINENKATKTEIKESITAGAKLKGTNMCILILAIIISCVGLNMNSAEMIIGAMLISPMMGAIIGMSYALATGNLKFFKRAFVALLIQITISVITSTLYFGISPISAPSTALLSRTMPTIWDVIIAIAGGLAGGIGVTRKEKGNILPGVAIATGLVPPLCTAGYGISVLNINYLLGALYLFFINAFFICVSAMIVFKIMKMPKQKGENEKEEKKIQRNLIIIGIITFVPSILLAYPVIKESAIKSSVQRYLNNEFKYEATQIVKSNIDVKNKKIQLALIGKVLDKEEILNLTNKLEKYNLQDMSLRINQTEVKEGITKEEIKEIIEKETKEDIVQTNPKEQAKMEEIKEKATLNTDKIAEQIKKEYSKVKDCTITNNKTVVNDENTNQTIIVNISLKENLTAEESTKLDNKLRQELGYNIIINKNSGMSEKQ